MASLVTSYRTNRDRNAIPEAIMVGESLLGMLEDLDGRLLTRGQ